MTTAWTLTAMEVCTDALRHLGVLGEDETATGSQMHVALRGLDIVLKELPLAGYNWPKLSAEVGLTWASVQAMALPADYYGFPVAWKTLNGQKSPLTQIPHASWVQMTDRAATGPVTHFYIDPAGAFNVWPVPPSDPVVTLQYQKVIDDVDMTATPDVLQSWKGALPYGVANEIAMTMRAAKDIRIEVAQRWGSKKQLALQSAIPHEVISFGVLD